MNDKSPERVKELCYRNLLLAMLGITRFLASMDIKPPTKWFMLFDSVRASSDILHVKLSDLDEDISNEFVQKEEILEKRIGKEKFYDVKEIKELKEKSNKIKV